MVDKEIAAQVRNVLGDEGFIFLTVKAKNIDTNQHTLDTFRQFCKEETDNDYVLGLRILLKGFEEDFKYAAVRDLITDLRLRVDELSTKVVDLETQLKNKESKKEDEGAF